MCSDGSTATLKVPEEEEEEEEEVINQSRDNEKPLTADTSIKDKTDSWWKLFITSDEEEEEEDEEFCSLRFDMNE